MKSKTVTSIWFVLMFNLMQILEEIDHLAPILIRSAYGKTMVRVLSPETLIFIFFDVHLFLKIILMQEYNF